MIHFMLIDNCFTFFMCLLFRVLLNDDIENAAWAISGKALFQSKKLNPLLSTLRYNFISKKNYVLFIRAQIWIVIKFLFYLLNYLCSTYIWNIWCKWLMDSFCSASHISFTTFLFVHSSVGGYLVCFHFLAIMNNVAMNICIVQVLCVHLFSFLLVIYLGVEMLSHMVILF